MWDETRQKVRRRLGIMVDRGLSRSPADSLRTAAIRVQERSIIEVPEVAYEELKDQTLSRLPRDARDWPVVASALSLGADVLIANRDFLGCGVATWTVGTLIAQLERRGGSPFAP